MTLKPLSLICFLFFHVVLWSQGDTVHYPNGVYKTLEDFMAKNPDTVTMIRKVNLGVDLNKAFLDTLVERCFFIDKDRDPLKKVFAVVHQGQIYFQEYGVRKNLSQINNKSARNVTYHCYRVTESGRYLYCKIFAPGDGVGYLGGGLAGAALSELMSPGPAFDTETAIVFVPGRKKFYAFNNCVQFEDFVKTRHPDFLFSCEKRRLNPDVIRATIQELNQL